MNKEIIPYLLPILTIIVFISVVFLNPEITGFAVKDIQDKVSANVVGLTDDNVVLPLYALVEVSLDDKKGSMSVKDFIEKNGSWYEIKNGGYPLINYYGEGYTGNHVYSLKLDDFNLGMIGNKDMHNLSIVIYYNGKIVSQTTMEINK